MKKKTRRRKWRRYQTGKTELDRAIHKLIEMAGGSPDSELLEEIVVTSLKMREDEMERGDIKMINAAMKELRYSLKIFYDYRHVRKVALFGSARTPRSHRDYKQARAFAKAMVKAGWMIITGGATGVMQAGNEGAGSANSFGVNIRLPFEQEANPVIAHDPKLINFKYFFTRKLTFIRESDATVLCPGGFGTHDEGFETLTLIQTGKTNPRPVVCLDPPGSNYWKAWIHYVKNHLVKTKLIDPEDLGLFHHTATPCCSPWCPRTEGARPVERLTVRGVGVAVAVDAGGGHLPLPYSRFGVLSAADRGDTHHDGAGREEAGPAR